MIKVFSDLYINQEFKGFTIIVVIIAVSRYSLSPQDTVFHVAGGWEIYVMSPYIVNM